MTWPMVVMLAVVLIALPAAWWNVTTAALVISWTIPQLYWLDTGDNLPTQIYVICDIAVLGVVACKPATWCISDRIVVAIFPVAWIFYVLSMDDTPRWWILWALVIAQFLSTTAETIFRLIEYHLDHRGLGFSLPPPFSFMAGRKVGVG